MARKITQIYHRILVFLHLSPLSLAEKCRVAFGAAILFILAIAMLLPYIWMSQLTRKSALDAGRARTDMLQFRHFTDAAATAEALPLLSTAGNVVDPNDREIVLLRLKDRDLKPLEVLHNQQRRMFEDLSEQH